MGAWFFRQNLSFIVPQSERFCYKYKKPRRAAFQPRSGECITVSLCVGINLNNDRNVHVALDCLCGYTNLGPLANCADVHILILIVYPVKELFQQFTVILILDHDLGRINTIITIDLYSRAYIPKTSIDVHFRIQELFSFLFELGVIAQLYFRTKICIDRAHHLSFRLSLRGRRGITAAGGEQNKYHGRRQNQSGQFFQHFHVGTSSRFVVFFIICGVPFHFEAGPLLALFYPTTVAFVNCQLHQTFSPAFVVFSRTNLRKDPLPHPGQKPENISGVYTILPRFGAKLKAMGTAGCRS